MLRLCDGALGMVDWDDEVGRVREGKMYNERDWFEPDVIGKDVYVDRKAIHEDCFGG